MRNKAKGQIIEQIGAVVLTHQRKEGQSAARMWKTEGRLNQANLNFSRRPVTEITAPISPKTLRKGAAIGNQETAYGFRALFSTLAIESGLWYPSVVERALTLVEKIEVRRT